VEEGIEDSLHPCYTCLLLLESTLAGKGNLTEPALILEEEIGCGNQGSADQYDASH